MITKSDKLFFRDFLILIIILGFSSACRTTLNEKIRTDLSITVNEVGKIPLRVGLYLSPEFMNYSKTPSHYSESGRIQMGEALSKGAEDITNKAFKQVVTIYKTDPESFPKGLDAIIIPEVEKTYGGFVGELTRQYSYYQTVTVKLKWTIKDMNQKTLYTNTFTTEVEYRNDPVFGQRERLLKAYTKAIEDQFAKAFSGITSINWWGGIK